MTTNQITVAGSSPIVPFNGGGADVVAPILMNSYGALTVPPYWRGVNLLADNLARFPRSIVRSGTRVAEGEAPHPLTRLLRRAPNGYVGNPFVFWRALAFAFVHRGNGLAWIERDPKTTLPVALHLVSIDDVRIGVFALSDEPDAPLTKWYLIAPRNKVLPAGDVIHLQAASLDGLQGVDPVALHEATLQHAGTLTRYQTRFFQKGTVIKGAISFPEAMSDDQLDTIAAWIRRNYTGPTAERDLLLIPKGGTPHNFTLSPQQSQTVEQMAAATKAIAQVLNVPPDLLFERSESKYSGVEAVGEWLERYTFGPLVDQIEAELTAKLLSPADQDAGWTVDLDTGDLRRSGLKTQTDVAVAKVTSRIATPNEVRADLGMPKLDDPEADRLKQSGDTSPAERVVNS